MTTNLSPCDSLLNYVVPCYSPAIDKESGEVNYGMLITRTCVVALIAIGLIALVFLIPHVLLQEFITTFIPPVALIVSLIDWAGALGSANEAIQSSDEDISSSISDDEDEDSFDSDDFSSSSMDYCNCRTKVIKEVHIIHHYHDCLDERYYPALSNQPHSDHKSASDEVPFYLQRRQHDRLSIPVLILFSGVRNSRQSPHARHRL